MLGWAALDVAIGLFFMYLLLSMIGTAIQEAIASLLKLRASNLRQGIENLLNDKKLTSQAKFEDLASAVYDHPAIKSLYRPDRKIFGLEKIFKIFGKKLESRPSYIPSSTVVMALLDTVRRQKAQANGVSADALEKIGADELFRSARTIVHDMPECDLKAQLMLLAGDIPGSIADFEKLEEADREKLEKKVTYAVTDAVERLEGWFNDSMDRVAGWYKRKAKSIAIVVGIAMAVALNAGESGEGIMRR